LEGVSDTVLPIEPQISFALAGVGPVTAEAVSREDRPDIAVESQGIVCPGPTGEKRDETSEQQGY